MAKIDPGCGNRKGAREANCRWDDVGPEHEMTEQDGGADRTDGGCDLVVGELDCSFVGKWGRWS